MQLKINAKRYGFTLAEVLITLGIIGVVAALTIPIIVNKVNDMQRNVQVKKIYSVLGNALTQIKNNNGLTLAGLFTDSTTAANLLAQQLNYSKLCNNAIADGCASSGTYLYLKGAGSWNFSNSSAIVLNTGEIIWIYKDYATNGWSQCNAIDIITQPYCFILEVDINGNKQPNQYGKDFFDFYVTKDTIIVETPKIKQYANHDCDTNLASSTGALCTYNILMNVDY